LDKRILAQAKHGREAANEIRSRIHVPRPYQ
jgi:hypothetical protein